MMPKTNNIPEVRFAGFTNAWEQRKLGEVATYRRGSFPQPYGKSEWYDGDGAMPFVQVADVSDEMNLVEETKQKISILAQPMSVFAEKNSVLVTLQGSIGRVAIMQYGAFVDRTVLIFEKYKAEIDKTFWAYIIKQKFIDEARKALLFCHCYCHPVHALLRHQKPAILSGRKDRRPLTDIVHTCDLPDKLRMRADTFNLSQLFC